MADPAHDIGPLPEPGPQAGGQLHLVPAGVRPPHGPQPSPVPAPAQDRAGPDAAERDDARGEGDRLPLRLRERAILLPPVQEQDRRLAGSVAAAVTAERISTPSNLSRAEPRARSRDEGATDEARKRPMNAITRSHFASIRSADRQEQGAAYSYLMEATRKPVDWAYEVWDELLEGLSHKDNRVRSISAQLLCNLAKSDPRGRMLEGFRKAPGRNQGPPVRDGPPHPAVPLARRRRGQEAAGKGGDRACRAASASARPRRTAASIRYDILQGLRRLYDAVEGRRDPQARPWH